MHLQGGGLGDVLEQLSNRTAMAGIGNHVVLCMANVDHQPVAEECKIGHTMETLLAVEESPEYCLAGNKLNSYLMR